MLNYLSDSNHVEYVTSEIVITVSIKWMFM